MPVVEVAPFGDEAIGAGDRQPRKGPHLARRQTNAFRHHLRTMGIITATAALAVEQRAADVRVDDAAGILVFELVEAAAGTTVAQALPLCVGHLFEAFGAPERQLLVFACIVRHLFLCDLVTGAGKG